MSSKIDKTAVINTLNNTATDKPLSAAQGKALNDGKAPKSHATSSNTYGQGSTNNFGHLKISDNYTSPAGDANNGVAASSKAVYDVYTNTIKNSQVQLGGNSHITVDFGDHNGFGLPSVGWYCVFSISTSDCLVQIAVSYTSDARAIRGGRGSSEMQPWHTF